MNDIDKRSQACLIDFSEPIPKEQDVIKEKLEGDFFFKPWHSCGVDYYLHLFKVKGPENLFLQSDSYRIQDCLLKFEQFLVCLHERFLYFSHWFEVDGAHWEKCDT